MGRPKAPADAIRMRGQYTFTRTDPIFPFLKGISARARKAIMREFANAHAERRMAVLKASESSPQRADPGALSRSAIGAELAKLIDDSKDDFYE